MNRVINVGRRKTAVARVYINAAKTPGKGTLVINKKDLVSFFPVDILQMKVMDAFKVLQLNVAEFDVLINVKGGGINGQAEAVRMGIARSLVELNPEYKSQLRKAGYLTRDSRMVERKKPGRPKARKRFQFSKR